MSKLVSDISATDTILVITEPPVGIEFGIDCITYETGPKFRGLTMIPPGLHFLYYGTGMGARQGYFFTATTGQIVVNQWDATNEQILPSHNLSNESLETLLAALRRGDLNSELGPYPLHQHHLWKQNSNFITTEVLMAAQCDAHTLLFPGDESSIFGDVDSVCGTRSIGAKSDWDKPLHRNLASTACFMDINAAEASLLDRVPRDASRSSELTRMQLDKSELLRHLVEEAQHYGGRFANLLGELQLAYMLFMLLYSYPALQHWKLLVSVICSSESFLRGCPAFTSAFLRVLYSQLNFAPTDFFESELSKDNFLGPVVCALFSALDGCTAVGSEGETLREHRKRLSLFIRKKFDLLDGAEGDGEALVDFLESEDDRPAVVSLREIQEALLRVGVDEGSDLAAMVLDKSEATPNSVGDCAVSPSATAERWSVIDAELSLVPGVSAVTKFPVPLLSVLPAHPADSGSETKQAEVSLPEVQMSSAELEAAKFGWRYPLLFASMRPDREDMAMAAMRVLDEEEAQAQLERGQTEQTADRAGAERRALYHEALRFVEGEIGAGTAL